MDDEREGFAERAIDVGSAVERLGDVLQDSEITRGSATRTLIS